MSCGKKQNGEEILKGTRIVKTRLPICWTCNKRITDKECVATRKQGGRIVHRHISCAKRVGVLE